MEIEKSDRLAVTSDAGVRKELHRTGSVLSRKESGRRKHAKIDRLDISYLYKDINTEESTIPRKHMLETLDYDLLSVPTIVSTELSDLGIRLESDSRQSRSKSKKPTSNSATISDQFLESVEFKLENSTPVRLRIPHVVRQTCEFIRKEISTEGIFRKSGLTSRVQKMKQRFADGVTDVFHSDDTVFDASSVLKQYLRELPNPLIPYNAQPTFLNCLDHPEESTKIEAVLLSVYLLPVSNIHILTYLMAFLYEVVNHSHQNRMGYKNLALVMTPNIMPVEERKHGSKGKELILSEKLAHEKNRKVVEILILYGDYVGWISPKLANALEVHLHYRNSDDEIDVEKGSSRDGRRKKRRSGSLTRMFGFLRKVTNGKGSETPCSGIDTPNDFGLHTPVMKGSTKKRPNEDPIFSIQKKKTILDAVRKNGLNGGDSNSPSGFLACPSPAVCYHPSPMRSQWKQLNLNGATPNIVRDKKRSKSTPDNARILVPTSSKSSSKHTKLGFGRKSGKKVALLHQVNPALQKSQRTASVVSIHHLTNSPRKKTSRPFSKFSDSSDSTSSESNVQIHDDSKLPNAIANQREHVSLEPIATTDDIRNEAFIESSLSFNTTEGGKEDSHNDIANENYLINPDSRNDDKQFMPVEALRMTPLIKDIQKLTLCAQLDYSTEKEALPQIEVESPPPLPDKSKILERNRTLRLELQNSPAITSVAKEFERTLKEEKIINLQSEKKRGGPCNNSELKRRGSVQERGVSPSQRKINSFRRRRSHDPVKSSATATQSPRFMSLRSPRSRPVPPPLVRSPTRCTLRRGRPNTAWTGLPKPSPVRTIAHVSREDPRSSRRTTFVSGGTITPREKSILKDSVHVNGQVMRRMSSVQELVHKLENKGKISKSAIDVGVDHQKLRRPSTLNIPKDRRSLPSNSGLWYVQEPKAKKQVAQVCFAETPHQIQLVSESSPNMGNEWLNGTNFDFDCSPVNSVCETPPVVVNRESIHFLKTKNAGKVSANVKMFDGMVKNPKSPTAGRSMIPRYTALHSLPPNRNPPSLQ